jgi:hypothetical protein
MLLRVTAGLLWAALAGCSGTTVHVPTDPGGYSIEPRDALHLRTPQSITLKNAYPAEASATFRAQGETLVVEQKQLTETALAMLSRALAQRGIATAEQAGKTIVLAVRADGYVSQPFRWTGKVVLEARLGDGSVISFPGRGRSLKGWGQAFDSAVLFSLGYLLHDHKFVSYLNR